MTKLREKKERVSIRTIFVTAFVGLVVLPFVILIALSYRIYSDHALERQTSFLMQSISFAQSQLDALVSNYNEVSLTLYHASIVELLDNELSEAEQELVLGSLVNIRNNNSGIIAVYLEHNDVVYHVGVEHWNFVSAVEPYREQIFAEQGSPIWITPELRSRHDGHSFIIARSLNSATQRGVGILYLVLDTREVANVLARINAEGVEIYLLNDDEVIFSFNEDRIGSHFAPTLETMQIMRGYDVRDIDEINSLVTFYESFRTRWVIATVTPTSFILEDFLPIRNAFISVAVIYLLFLSIMPFLLHKFVFRPINRLIKNMDEVAIGNFDRKTEKVALGELQSLNTHFNDMTDKLKGMISHIEEQEKIKNRFKIQALIAQLNPHFIFNTLNTIKWLAVINKQKNIQELTDSFSRVLMTTTKDENDTWTFGKELELIKNYINIQKYRYMDFDVFFSIEDEANACLINKFLIQPLVENAIVHGINKREKGIIRIHAWLDKDLHIRIEDNGVGFNVEKLQDVKVEKLNEDLHAKIGLQNIKQIIELEHGLEHGIHIESELGKGTIIECILPIQMEAVES